MWKAFGGSVQGASHIRVGLPCQDANYYHISDRGIVAVIADGLGSALYAEMGAQLAVNTAALHLVSSLQDSDSDNQDHWQSVIRTAFEKARAEVEHLAAEKEIPLREYATTLITLVMTETWFAIGHLGDGAVICQYADGVTSTLSPPESGEYANEVLPITGSNAMSSIRILFQNAPLKAVALMTDGLQNLALSSISQEPFIPFFKPLFELINSSDDSDLISEELKSFLASEEICSRTDDDKTLVVIGRI